jgi:prepilin-type N-terminal cleavage/methylation domain-containing protein
MKAAVSHICHHRRRRAFTLVETMVAVIILGLLAAAVTWSFRAPLRRARMAEAIEQVKYLDASSRAFARRFGRNVEIVYDVSEGTLERRENGRPDATFRTAIASPFRIQAVRTRGRTEEYAEAAIAVSPLGISQTYAVKLAGPEAQRWLVVTGLGGEILTLADDAQVEAIFAKIAPSPLGGGRDAD